MSEQKPGATPAAPAPAATPVPAQSVQPTPGATQPATPASPAPAQPAATPATGTVPLPALLEERNKRQALEAELDLLRRQHAAPQPHQPQQPIIQPVDPKVELERLWDSDPRKAVQVEIMYAMDWRDRLDASLNSQADQMANKYADFNNYRSSALSYVRSLPAHQRGAPGIIEAAYYMVRGQNVDQLLKQQETELIERYRRGEITAQQLQTPPGGFSAPPVQPTQTQLTADQMKVAEMMGLSPDQYASQIKLAAPTGGR